VKLTFYKYQGTGNDFIMLDNLDGSYSHLTKKQIKLLCNRHFGIGADGLICINRSDKFDFEVDYSNSDGSKSFCGNGARCSIAFAHFLGIDVKNVLFSAIDGVHRGCFHSDEISIQMQDVNEVKKIASDYEIYTGSPHYIRFTNNINKENIVEFGKKIRYAENYAEKGINVNLAEIQGYEIAVLTYERGVEDETLSCGTGVTAVALAYAMEKNLKGKQSVNIHTKGGVLKVSFIRQENSFTNIYLSGPAEFVFKGEIHV
jgi:diaminopimelate epimerase